MKGAKTGGIFPTMYMHCVPLAIETIKLSFKVSQLDLIALK